jgi:hypothetical protein
MKVRTCGGRVKFKSGHSACALVSSGGGRAALPEMTKEGFTGMVFILLIASSSVPRTLGFAGLSKPTWLDS